MREKLKQVRFALSRLTDAHADFKTDLCIAALWSIVNLLTEIVRELEKRNINGVKGHL